MNEMAKEEAASAEASRSPSSTLTLRGRNGVVIVDLVFRSKGKDTFQKKAEHLLAEEYLKKVD